ncbi:MAG: hypothetical protein JO168_12710 [Solirubrobacterales bacterium]|nr:hypothetical protein [Solirubrobacterales bacterium]
MGSRASITVLRSREELERLWRDARYRPEQIDHARARVRFVEAPGDRGTEIHVELEPGVSGGVLGEAVRKLRGTEPLAKAKDGLHRFKQQVETGVIARSDGAPEGQQLRRQLRQRPAQPLEHDELQRAGA